MAEALVYAVNFSVFTTGIALVVANWRGWIDDAVFWGGCVVTNGTLFLLNVSRGDFALSTINGFFTALSAYFWWKNRRKGKWKRAARELGAKSRARVEALVENMTPSPIPSPVGA